MLHVFFHALTTKQSWPAQLEPHLELSQQAAQVLNRQAGRFEGAWRCQGALGKTWAALALACREGVSWEAC